MFKRKYYYWCKGCKKIIERDRKIYRKRSFCIKTNEIVKLKRIKPFVVDREVIKWKKKNNKDMRTICSHYFGSEYDSKSTREQRLIRQDIFKELKWWLKRIL